MHDNEARFAELRAEIGDDTFDGLEALADCDHAKSLNQAVKAKQSSNPNYALAGLWLELLNHADAGDKNKAQSLLPALVKQDWNVDTEADAKTRLGKGITALENIREEFGMPRTCPGRG